jgi:hypothetical protein
MTLPPEALPPKFRQISQMIRIDKNSLCDGLNIQKRELYVKGMLAKDLGFIWKDWGRPSQL